MPVSNVERDKKRIKSAIKKIKARKLLKHLGKEKCDKTALELAHFFFTLPPTPGGTHTFAGVYPIARWALDEQRPTRKTKKTDPFVKKLKALAEAYQQTNSLLHDPDIQSFYQYLARRNDEVPPRVVIQAIEEYHRATQRLSVEVKAILFEDGKRGRPSIKEFKNFVYHVAKKFNQLSDDLFSVEPHKDSKGRYIPTSAGHLFVCEVIEFLYEISGTDIRFTDKNIFVACAAARTRLRKEKSLK